MSKGIIKIIDTVDSIRAKINFELRHEVDRRMRTAAPIIQARAGTLIASRLTNSRHAQSILSGQLQKDFGLTESVAKAALTQLIAAVKRNIRVELRGVTGSQLVFTMSVSILPEGLTSVLGNIGTYESNGHQIGWMRWLLTKGVEVVVEDYFVAYGPSIQSRSGGALMLNTGKSGRDFRVDPAFAGTENDNFVVNTIREALPEIGEIMRSYL
jgi:hypothetical protein